MWYQKVVTETGNEERGTGNGERGTGSGEPGAGNEHGERENEKLRIGNEVTDRRLVCKLGFVLIFHFPVLRASSPIPVTTFSNIHQNKAKTSKV